MKKIGIRHEDKYLSEKRVPLIPDDIKSLTEKYEIEFKIESSGKRIFCDEEYQIVGAKVVNNIDDCDIILGVKEIPVEKLLPTKTYIYFSHVIKGQGYNMPMLKRLIELNCNLIEYEKIVDEAGRRLIFFGRFAGLAGMINTLWSLGQRYSRLGINTPFLNIRQAHTYKSLDDAISDVRRVGDLIRKDGLPDEVLPFITAFTGYGNVSRGAWEIFDLLPYQEISPEEILTAEVDKHNLYKVVFKEKDLVEKISGEFELQDYYDNPSDYRDKFHRYLHKLSCVVNGMYWDERYPRIITKDLLKDLFESNHLKLAVIGDITCDPEGSIECTHKGTEIEDPVFVYNPSTQTSVMGFDGDGVLVMAVDILPSELPRESSISFSNALSDFIPEIAEADFNANFNAIKLPLPIKSALILLNGQLTPDYKYLSEFL
ncbi:MAG: hypothetical protein KIT33_00955 [Candidatus Kapabacteria bacterium]|nr:hypothetical protein [Ignavibacteriota bacterium]MCW5883516.1 hypothetical protein [Candidatus Kapabacteria bacterium]